MKHLSHQTGWIFIQVERECETILSLGKNLSVNTEHANEAGRHAPLVDGEIWWHSSLSACFPSYTVPAFLLHDYFGRPPILASKRIFLHNHLSSLMFTSASLPSVLSTLLHSWYSTFRPFRPAGPPSCWPFRLLAFPPACLSSCCLSAYGLSACWPFCLLAFPPACLSSCCLSAHGLSACWPFLLPFCLLALPTAGPSAFLRLRLLTFLPAGPSACLPFRMLASPPAYLAACLSSCLRAFLPTRAAWPSTFQHLQLRPYSGSILG